MTFPVRIIPQPETIRAEHERLGRFMTRHELTLDAAVDTVPAGVMVIAEMDADGEFTAVKITKVRI